MFATLTVVLPSEYEGGEIRLSHSGMSETLDLAKTAEAETSVLAWYTGVQHEVKPITSGYRLALSYNLIHTSNSTPRPVVPKMCGGIQRLRRVLQRWKEGNYPLNCFPSSSPPFFAYILDQKYDEDDLLHGAERLKGTDAVKAEHLFPLAQELGFVVGFANLECRMLGSLHDDEYYASKRRRLGDPHCSSDYASSGGVPTMEQVDEIVCSLTRIVDREGNLLVGGGKARVSEEVLVPDNALDLATPDGHGYEGYAVSRRFILASEWMLIKLLP
jgi:hypothetical protein